MQKLLYKTDAVVFTPNILYFNTIITSLIRALPENIARGQSNVADQGQYFQGKKIAANRIKVLTNSSKISL